MFWKSFVISIYILLFSIVLFAQPVTVNIINKVPNDSITTFILEYADGHYQQPSQQLLLNRNGVGHLSFSLKYPLFVVLKMNDQEYKLLLSPGRDLIITVPANSSTVSLQFEGKGAPENKLLQEIKLDAIPFYMKEDWQTNRYAKMSLDSIDTEVVGKALLERKSKTALVMNSSIPQELKKLLASELVYVEQCYLNDLGRNYMRWANNPDYEVFSQKVMAMNPIPDSATLSNGLYANMMLGYQQSFAITELAKKIKSDRKATQEAIAKSLGESFETVDSLVKKFGERYIVAWLYARNNYPVSLQDKVLFNKFMDAYNDGYIHSARYLFDILNNSFPGSHYLDIAKNEIAKIDKSVEKNRMNKSIVFHPTKKPANLQEVLTAYKGKIVYLDFWGTWCGPCRIEMGYVKELKKRFKDKEVVFVYLDMDDDEKDAIWINYVNFYGIEGEHYRLNKSQINGCWEDVKKAGGETHRYPTYLLFNKEGKLVYVDAERPSSKEKLYRQIEELF